MTEESFAEQVYRLTRAIPSGKVLNYGAVAAMLGQPREARAVGYALSNLPANSDVPWQRVVGKEGRYGKISIRSFSFSRAEQVALLQDEGIVFNDNEQFVLDHYLWQPSLEELDAILKD